MASGLLAAVPGQLAHADSFMDQFRDTNGWFDMSDWVLNNAAGFMPVPIVITEPAVGEGLGLAALFFHAPKGYDREEFEDAGQKTEDDTADFVVPNISAIAAARTNNGTWFVGGGHFAQWKEDTIRYDGLAGYASVNLTFYAQDGLLEQLFPNGISFNGEGFLLQQPLSFRLGKSNFFLGAEYDYSTIKTTLDLGLPLPPDAPTLELDTQLSALGAFLYYDTRDTRFTPNKGLEAKFRIMRNDDAIGSDFSYSHAQAFARKYMALNQKWNLAVRLEAEQVSGDVPFYMLPFINMRGIPVMRYQGESVAFTEAEARWAFHKRFSAIGFLGAGKAADSFSDFGDATTRVTKGLGFRYFSARKLGMHVGIDVAKGPEDTYWYLTMGSAWH